MALEYRNELKYVVSIQQMAVLRNRIRFLMALDDHVGEKGKYTIRSVYFDDYRNTCFYENENGTSPREKFRIRIYNGDGKTARLELKRKEGGKIHKDACILSEEQSLAFLKGKGLMSGKGSSPLLRKFGIKYQSELYRPKVIVEYERVPYICPLGNVRITMDENISSSGRTDLFLEERIPLRPVLEAGQHVLEVKYDEYLPDAVYRTIQLAGLRQTAFSKYYLCRKYHL